MANWQNPFTTAWDRSCDLSLPNMSPCPACNREHWSQPQRGVRMSTRSILGYILSSWPTWRTVAKNSQRHGHLQCAVCSARPLANDWLPCCPRVRTIAELLTFCYAQIPLHENLGKNLGWSRENDSVLSMSWKYVEKDHIVYVLLSIEFRNQKLLSCVGLTLSCHPSPKLQTGETIHSYMK